MKINQTENIVIYTILAIFASTAMADNDTLSLNHGPLILNDGSQLIVNTRADISGTTQVIGKDVVLISNDIGWNDPSRKAIAEATGVFMTNEILVLQSNSDEAGQMTAVVLEKDSIGTVYNGDDGTVSGTHSTSQGTKLYYISGNQLSATMTANPTTSTTNLGGTVTADTTGTVKLVPSDKMHSFSEIIIDTESIPNSIIAVADKSASILVTAADGSTHGMMVSDESTSITGDTTTVLLDDNGMTLSSDDGADVQLRGVADGTAGDHAANYGQVQEVEAQVQHMDDARKAAIGEWKNPRTTTLRGAIENSEGLIQRNTTRITTNEGNIAANYSRLQSLDRKLSGGIAAVTALGMIPDPAPGHRFSLGMGYGNFEGENAAALGFTGRVTNSISIKAGAGFNNDTFAAGGGVGYSW